MQCVFLWIHNFHLLRTHVATANPNAMEGDVSPYQKYFVSQMQVCKVFNALEWHLINLIG